MVPKALRLAKRVSGEAYCDLPLTLEQKYIPDLNLLAVTIAGGRLPTTGEYLTAAARLFGMCSNLYSAIENIRLSSSFESDADRIKACREIVQASQLPKELVQEIEFAILEEEEMLHRGVLNQILSSCLSYVDHFELNINGLRIRHKPHIHTWGDILRKALTDPEIVVETPTEVRLTEALEAISAFLTADETELQHSPELIVSHGDIFSHQTREPFLRFFERINLDPCKVPPIILLHDPSPTERLAAKTLCQIHPRERYTICITVALRRVSAALKLFRGTPEGIVSRLRAEGFVNAPCGEPLTLAQALHVETPIFVQKDLRRCIIESFILRRK